MTHENKVREWLFQSALPFWSRAGVDRESGGFVESLTLDGRDSGADFKRTRVTARQIYVFSQAHLLGFVGAEEIVAHGIDHLLGCAWISDEAGFARRVSRLGKVIDPTPDLYDHAFALFALAWAYRAVGREDLRDWAARSLASTESLLRDHDGGGFWNDATRAGWRQQNPHMHLLEAALAAVEAFGEDRYATLAKEIADLFSRRFFDRARGMLTEFFDADWRRAPGAEGDVTEPGHQFEWAWILNNCRRLVDVDMTEEMRALCRTGERFGVDPQTGLTYNCVSRHGRPIDRGSRSWPNTERIKAAVALWDRDGVDPGPVFAMSSNVLFERYLSHSPAGTWIDAFDESGAPLSTTIPASTLYHVVLAFSELLRVEDARHAAPPPYKEHHA